MRPRRSGDKLLVCCSVLWVVVSSSSSSGVEAPPPPPPAGCDSMLAFSSDDSSTLSEGNRNIHRRSLSPWRWRSTTVKDRVPSTLWEAECSGGSFCSGPDSRGLNSVPVYQSVLVLTRQEGRRCYTASYQTVAAGCTCVRATTSRT
ncbi:interleukin 17a/f2 [Scophthalmus maximus]|uniref:Uncharacterized protein n=1 Tax=Scophthalmus maximus TaxID=52904 RepID=A0A8D3B2H7_SCOMX|nr:interleukin 17a/f2 [Scophthalmus maximus]